MNTSVGNGLGEDYSAYEGLVYLDSAQGDLKAGMAHYKKFVKYMRSSFVISEVRQAEELEVIYEMDEKEKEEIADC